MNKLPATTKSLLAYEPSDGQVKFGLEDVSLRMVGDTEVLVRIVATGLCHTDLVFASAPKEFGAYPKVLGHEGAGYVEQTGKEVKNLKAGDAVLLSFSSCSKCRDCQAQHPSFCELFAGINYLSEPGVFQSSKGQNPSGKFFGQSSLSNYTIVNESSVVNVASLVTNVEDLKLFAPLGCGFQTGMGTVDVLADAGAQDSVVVLGLGGVGLTAIMAARLNGCHTIVAVDRVKGRLDLAKELGATHVFNTSDTEANLAENVKSFTKGAGSTITIDTTGNLDIIASGLALTANRGQMILIGAPTFGARLSVDIASFLQSGKILRGSIEGDVTPSKYIPKMIERYRDGKFPIDKLVKFYPIQDFELALSDMESGATVKPILVW